MKVWGFILAMLVSTVADAADGGVIRFSGAIVVGTASNPTDIHAPFSQNNPAREITETSMDVFFQNPSIPNAEAWQHYLHASQQIPDTKPLSGVVKTITYE